MTKYIEQLSREDMANMSPKEINDAHARGAFNEVLGKPAPVDYDAADTITREDLKNMSLEQIAELHSAGKLDDILGKGK